MQSQTATTRAWHAPDSILRTAHGSIGLHLTVEEVLNILPFMFMSMNGALPFTGHASRLALDAGLGFYWLLTVVNFFRNRAKIHWELWTTRYAAIFLFYTLLSVIWSHQRMGTLYLPFITSICTFLYCSYLIDRFTLADFTRMLVIGYTFMLVASIFVATLLPRFGIDDGSSDPNNRGAWQGICSQKNGLGLISALAIAAALSLKPKSHLDHAWRWLLLSSALVCAFKSESREAWIAISLQFLLFIIVRFIQDLQPRSRLPILFSIVMASILLLLAVYYNLDALLALIGRNRTASGRTDLWEASFLLIQRRPWLGYGLYGVFGTNIAWDISVRAGWMVTSSHNNYVEVLLSYGIIGLLLYLPIPLSSLLYMVRALFSYSLPEIEILLYIMIVILLVSLTSPIVLYTPAIGLILLLYAVSHLERVERSGFMRIRE